MKWSREQELAIAAEKGNYLVSAGAGSGKTAVLTERVYRLIKKGYRISRFLVLTFTNDAAAEMKGRIRDRLLQDKELSHLGSEIENSHIETFDSFAAFIVKKYGFEMGIARNFTNLDGTIASIKRHNIIDEIITQGIKEEDPVLLKFIRLYCRKNIDQIKDLLVKICEQSDRFIEKEKYFQTFIDKYYVSSYIEERINQEYIYDINLLHSIIEDASSLEDIEDASNIISFVDGLLECSNYDSLYQEIVEKGLSFPKKPNTPTEDKDFRDYVKGKFDRIKAGKYGNSETIKSSYLESKDMVNWLIQKARQIENALDSFKEEKNAYCFNDIARFSYQLLHKKDIGLEMSQMFDFIMVDEYQDTNDIQEGVIQILGNNNLYMVGDIKQSIYRFRNANCDIFQKKYEQYSLKKGGEVIDLNTSYRSRKEVVDMINELFKDLMDKSTNPIDYEKDHIFTPGFAPYNVLIDKKEDYRLKIYCYEAEKADERLKKEIDIIMDDIVYKINHNYEVYDKKLEAMRPCSYKDFAIIIDRGTSFNDYRRAFANRGIPLNIVGDEKIKSSDISYISQNLIKLFYYSLKEEYNDEYIHAYVSISRSFLMQMKDQDIFTITKNKLFMHTELQAHIFNVISEHKNGSLREMLEALFREFDLYYKLMSLPKYEYNCHKAESFLDIAENMDNLGFTLEDLITYFRDLNDHEEEIKLSSSSSSSNSVTLINIHKSKGLEYPFVYFPGLHKKFSRQEISTSFLVTKDYGVILPLTGVKDNMSLFNSQHRREETQKDFEEKLRLFYVALTRVRERAILLMDISKDSGIYDLTSSHCFLNFLSYLGLATKYGQIYQMKNELVKQKSAQKSGKKVEIREISIPSKVIEKRRASKENNEQIDESLLEFGSELHYLLEIVDYENKNVSFIKEGNLRKYVNNVIHSPLFQNVKNDDIYHEYAYDDENLHVHGIIDCLVKHEDYIDIIDFKLKNIEDEKYVDQLHTYRDYVKTITDLPIKMHLISAITGEVKEIE